jgi:hypothetical protein
VVVQFGPRIRQRLSLRSFTLVSTVDLTVQVLPHPPVFPSLASSLHTHTLRAPVLLFACSTAAASIAVSPPSRRGCEWCTCAQPPPLPLPLPLSLPSPPTVAGSLVTGASVEVTGAQTLAVTVEYTRVDGAPPSIPPIRTL